MKDLHVDMLVLHLIVPNINTQNYADQFHRYPREEQDDLRLVNLMYGYFFAFMQSSILIANQ